MLGMIHKISKRELKDRFDKHEDLQLINVLSPEYYRLGSIPGSRRIPYEDIDKRLAEIDKSREVIVYCASKKCDASKKAAEKLSDMGFKVSAYEGGIEEWKAAGYPIE